MWALTDTLVLFPGLIFPWHSPLSPVFLLLYKEACAWISWTPHLMGTVWEERAYHGFNLHFYNNWQRWTIVLELYLLTTYIFLLHQCLCKSIGEYFDAFVVLPLGFFMYCCYQFIVEKFPPVLKIVSLFSQWLPFLCGSFMVGCLQIPFVAVQLKSCPKTLCQASFNSIFLVLSARSTIVLQCRSSVLPFLSVNPKDMKSQCTTALCPPVFIIALFTAKTWNRQRMADCQRNSSLSVAWFLAPYGQCQVDPRSLHMSHGRVYSCSRKNLALVRLALILKCSYFRNREILIFSLPWNLCIYIQNSSLEGLNITSVKCMRGCWSLWRGKDLSSPGSLLWLEPLTLSAISVASAGGPSRVPGRPLCTLLSFPSHFSLFLGADQFNLHPNILIFPVAIYIKQSLFLSLELVLALVIFNVL